MKEPKKSETYKNPNAPNQLISTIIHDYYTPILSIKFCNLIKPFYYPNSPNIPRYSITCIIDAEKDKNFLNNILSIEKTEKVESIIKRETIKEDGKSVSSGNFLIKFQSKEVIPIYIKDKHFKENENDNDELQKVNLEDEFAVGEQVQICFDILRYTKKNSLEIEHGLSFKPTAIFYCPQEMLSDEVVFE
jgi:hypothetical protein